jgi:hypothetical protein
VKTFDEWYLSQLESVSAISPATKKIAKVLWDNVFAVEIEKLQKQNEVMKQTLQIISLTREPTGMGLDYTVDAKKAQEALKQIEEME